MSSDMLSACKICSKPLAESAGESGKLIIFNLMDIQLSGINSQAPNNQTNNCENYAEFHVLAMYWRSAGSRIHHVDFPAQIVVCETLKYRKQID